MFVWSTQDGSSKRPHPPTHQQVPNVLLEEMGPCFTLTLRRHQLAAPDLWRTACKQPREYVICVRVCVWLIGCF